MNDLKARYLEPWEKTYTFRPTPFEAPLHPELPGHGDLRSAFIFLQPNLNWVCININAFKSLLTTKIYKTSFTPSHIVTVESNHQASYL